MDTLIAEIRALKASGPLDQAAEAHRLASEARTALLRIRDAAIYDARCLCTYTAIGDVVGISVDSVNKAVTNHRKRMAADPAVGRRHPAGRRRSDGAIPAQRQSKTR
jgi:hypothetical protein